jgi:hypothetical protein
MEDSSNFCSCRLGFNTNYHSHFAQNLLSITVKRSIRNTPPVGVRICDPILVFNVLWLEGHLEPNYHFAFLNIP